MTFSHFSFSSSFLNFWLSGKCGITTNKILKNKNGLLFTEFQNPLNHGLKFKKNTPLANYAFLCELGNKLPEHSFVGSKVGYFIFKILCVSVCVCQCESGYCTINVVSFILKVCACKLAVRETFCLVCLLHFVSLKNPVFQTSLICLCFVRKTV